ncbi:MAG TPA: glycosyl hydrolase [Bryobacteraceae bacterium]|nr:glycosyl hydrolase [Bryobacteraceae bacterium]
MRHPSWFLGVTGFVVAAGAVVWQAAPPADPALVTGPAERELLHHPKTLGARRAPLTLAGLRAAFADPPAANRSMPLWVWNDELTWPRLQEQLAQFKAQGMGGVFVHPRPGLMTEYLGADWFRLWKLSAEEGRRLGLEVNIYDENSYPSGFAGGHVPALAPDTAAQYVTPEFMDAPRGYSTRGASVAAFVVERDAGGRVTSARRLRDPSEAAGHTLAVFRLKRASGNPWTGEFPYVDLTNPQTAVKFIETTFERYQREVGAEFGQTIRWSFDDEPLIATAGAYDSAPLALPLSYNTLSEFRKRNGYDLADHLPSLYWDLGDYRKVRFDYWQTLHDLWKENYFRPLFQWCDRHRVGFTGHWMEHTWPEPWISPDDASLYAYEHAPGIDMLEGANIRTQGKDPHMLFTIKQVASVSHQLGRRAFCEAYGVSGWDSTLEHYKRFGDWLMVHGIDFMDQHLAFATVRGARKRDHPQSFTDVSPWWPYYRIHGDYLGRVSVLLTSGEVRNRVVMLEPTTSGFLVARRAGPNPEFETMRQANAALNQFLADHQVDFDLADEYMLEWFGKAGNRKLAIGDAAYDLVIWPEHMTNVRTESLPLLESYLAGGGEILALSAPAAYVNGREDGRVRALRERYASQWHAVSSHQELLARIQERLQPRVRFDAELPSGVGFAERFLGNGDRMLFFTNTGLEMVKARATVQGRGLEEWDAVSGAVRPAVFTRQNGSVAFPLELAPAGSAAYRVTSAELNPQPEPPSPVHFDPVAAAAWKATPDQPNVLVLDYCDLAAAGVEERNVNTWQANWTLWQMHGFERPAWDNAVQYRTRIFDRNHFAPASGFEAAFHFQVDDPAALSGLELAIELPELYQVKVNGAPVSFTSGKRWLDPHIRSASIEGAARTGENTITVAAHPFDVRMELENVYLRGHFKVNPAEQGFRIAAPAALELGSWAKQGYPFYGSSVLYESAVETPKGALRVELGAWRGSLAEVLLDGKQAVLMAWPPWHAAIPVEAGKHRVAIRVVSTPRNTFGPFHNRTRPRMRAWPAAWADFPEHQPPGSAYDILDYGLISAPTLSIGKEARVQEASR